MKNDHDAPAIFVFLPAMFFLLSVFSPIGPPHKDGGEDEDADSLGALPWLLSRCRSSFSPQAQCGGRQCRPVVRRDGTAEGAAAGCAQAAVSKLAAATASKQRTRRCVLASYS
jgi:hypothetical protein